MKNKNKNYEILNKKFLKMNKKNNYFIYVYVYSFSKGSLVLS